MIKKIAFVALLSMASSGAFAANACIDGAATALTGQGTNDFIQAALSVPVKCSANSYVDYSQTTARFAVASMSSKGKNTFKGSSNGGGVVVSAPCAGGACTAGGSDLSTALTAAEAITGSN